MSENTPNLCSLLCAQLLPMCAPHARDLCALPMCDTSNQLMCCNHFAPLYLSNSTTPPSPCLFSLGFCHWYKVFTHEPLVAFNVQVRMQELINPPPLEGVDALVDFSYLYISRQASYVHNFNRISIPSTTFHLLGCLLMKLLYSLNYLILLVTRPFISGFLYLLQNCIRNSLNII